MLFCLYVPIITAAATATAATRFNQQPPSTWTTTTVDKNKNKTPPHYYHRSILFGWRLMVVIVVVSSFFNWKIVNFGTANEATQSNHLNNSEWYIHLHKNHLFSTVLTMLMPNDFNSQSCVCVCMRNAVHFTDSIKSTCIRKLQSCNRIY